MPGNITTGTAVVTIIDDAVTVGIPLGVGFNLIGIPVILDTPLTASTLAAELGNQGATVDTIRAFSGGFLSWNPLAPSLNDFDIDPNAGFFVQVSQAAQAFTP